MATIRPEPIMQLRDPYGERLFPSIIGTQDFYQSERLGLVEYISDGEECMCLYHHQWNSTLYSMPSLCHHLHHPHSSHCHSNHPHSNHPHSHHPHSHSEDDYSDSEEDSDDDVPKEPAGDLFDSTASSGLSSGSESESESGTSSSGYKERKKTKRKSSGSGDLFGSTGSSTDLYESASEGEGRQKTTQESKVITAAVNNCCVCQPCS